MLSPLAWIENMGGGSFLPKESDAASDIEDRAQNKRKTK